MVVQQKWAAAVPELESQPGFSQAFMPWGRAPQVGELLAAPLDPAVGRNIAALRARSNAYLDVALQPVRLSG